jgi:hypothetical protein
MIRYFSNILGLMWMDFLNEFQAKISRYLLDLTDLALDMEDSPK